MNGTYLLQALMGVPEPKAGAPGVTVSGATWEVPIHDAAHVRSAIALWPNLRFTSPGARKEAAQRIVERAIKFSIISEGLKLIKGGK